MAAGNHELNVTGVVDLRGTYEGQTIVMKCLVTPDLNRETIVSTDDAQKLGAIWINPRGTKRSAQSPRCKKLKRRKRSTYAKAKLNKKAEPFRQKASDQQQRARESPSAAQSGSQAQAAPSAAASTEPRAQEAPSAATPAQEHLSADERAKRARDAVAALSAAAKSRRRDMFDRAYPEDTRYKWMIEELCSQFSCITDKLPSEPMEGEPMIINLKPGWREQKTIRATTHIPTPIHFREPGKRALDELEEAGVIKLIGHSVPRPFCTRGFFVLKTDKVEDGVRLVTDYSEVNKVIERPEHPMTSGANLLKQIPAKARVLAKLDFVKGYYQVKLAEVSQHITAFITEWGTYIYLRAPMGLSASSDEFNRRSDDALAGQEGYLKLVDDLLVYAETEEQLFERLTSIMERCQKANIALSKKKFEISRRIKFAGYVISEEGTHPSEERLTAIREYPQPKSQTDIRSYTSLAAGVGNYHPDVAHLSKPLTDVQGKQTFQWNEDMERSFLHSKKVLSGPATLKHFDPKMATSLITDACKIGLGYLLIQQKDIDKKEFNLIECGSRKTTAAEANYSPCSLETLGVAWAMNKCRFYLLGMPSFRVLTDHRTLEKHFRKPLSEIQNPTQLRLREKCIEYNFSVVWIAGKYNVMADALSRHPVFPAEERNDDHCTCMAIRTMEKHDDPALKEMIIAANTDEEYCLIRKAIQQHMTTRKLHPDHPARAIYNNQWKHLSVAPNNLIIYDGTRILVPKPCRQKVLEMLHKGHCGQEKSIMSANRDYMWSGMNDEVKKFVNKCIPCREARKSQPQQPIIQCNQAKAPMQVVAMDLMANEGQNYLVMVDQFSGFPMVAKLQSTNTKAITDKISEWFCLCGFPEQAFSDSGPQFRSEFKRYCEDNKIVHITSSAYNPQSNGLAESGVQIVKNLLKKCNKQGDDWGQFMLELLYLRNTPNTSSHKSPAQMFFGRRQRTQLPTLPGKMGFDIQAAEEGAQQRKDTREKEYEKRRTKELPPLGEGERVLIQTPDGWTQKATVTSSRHEGRSYDVKLDSGAEKTLNRRILMPLPEDPDVGDEGAVTEITSERQEEAATDADRADEPAPRRSARNRSFKPVCSCCKVLTCVENIRQILL